MKAFFRSSELCCPSVNAILQRSNFVIMPLHFMIYTFKIIFSFLFVKNIDRKYFSWKIAFVEMHACVRN
jgi:hypothetical protein